MGVSVPVFSINPVFASVKIELVQVMAVVSAYVDIADGNVIFFETERVIEASLSRAVCDVSVCLLYTSPSPRDH